MHKQSCHLVKEYSISPLVKFHNQHILSFDTQFFPLQHLFSYIQSCTTRSRVTSRSGSSLRTSLPPVSCCGEGKTRLEPIPSFTLHIVPRSPPPPLKKVCDVSGAKVFKSIKKDARVFVIDHCGHAISVEQPKRCALLIENLISQGR